MKPYRVLLAIAMLASGAALAHASPRSAMCQHAQLHGQFAEFPMSQGDNQRELVLYPGVRTILRFSDSLLRTSSLEVEGISLSMFADSAMLVPTANARGTLIFETRGYIARFAIRLAATPGQALSFATVRARAEAEPPGMTIKRNGACTNYAVDEAMSDWLLHESRVARSNDKAPASQTIHIRAHSLLRVDNRGYLLIDIANHSSQPFRLERVQVFDQSRSRHHGSMVRLSIPGSRKNKLFGVIRPKSTVSGVIAIADTRALGNTFSILASEPTEGLAVWSDNVRLADIPVFKPDPTPLPVLEDTAELDIAISDKGKKSIHVQGLYGAIWLADPQSSGSHDATSMIGYGARLSHGLTRHLGAEVQLALMSSGHASFTSPADSGTSGELQRSIWTGRMLAGGVVRFGDYLVPTMRAGVGLQGTHSKTYFAATNRNPMPGPDVPFAFEPVWFLGTGLDLRLGEHLRAGIDVSVVRVMVERASNPASAASFEAGFHLGYAWRP